MKRAINLFLMSLAVLLALAGGAVAFAQGTTTEVTLEPTEMGFSVPEQVQAGYVGFTLNNTGQMPTGVTIARLKDGTTLDDLQAAAAQNPGAAFGLLELVGGPASVGPGASQRVVLNVTEGQYVLVNATADNPIAGTFMAVAGDGTGASPAAGATVGLRDFAFDLPATIAAGAQTWQVNNNGPQPHEIVLFKLAEGATFEDVLAFFGGQTSGPPPFSAAGGTGAMDAGRSNWADLTLDAGNYLAVCFIPDPATGKPHFELGMVANFAVPGGDAGTPPATIPTTGAEHRTPFEALIGWGAILVLAGLTARAILMRRGALQ